MKSTSLKSRIVVFAKAPQPGVAKTRLIPALGPDGAARLAEWMLHRTLAEALAADVEAVELCATPAMADPAWGDLGLPPGLHLSEQGEGDLGARMARVAQATVANGEAIILIGTDCPELTRRRLDAAADALQSHDAVMHPAADGGYVLLGMRRFHPRIFEDIAWSTDSVAATTLGCLDELGWSVHLADCLHDIDDTEDLAHLPEPMRVASHD